MTKVDTLERIKFRQKRIRPLCLSHNSFNPYCYKCRDRGDGVSPTLYLDERSNLIYTEIGVFENGGIDPQYIVARMTGDGKIIWKE